MVHATFLMFAALVAVAFGQTCPPYNANAPGCRNFCKVDIPGTAGKYHCCDDDSSSTKNEGRCPTYKLQPNEIEVMCDVNDTNRPHSLNCKRDSDCFVFEKCCYTPFTQHLICRLAIYD